MTVHVLTSVTFNYVQADRLATPHIIDLLRTKEKALRQITRITSARTVTRQMNLKTEFGLRGDSNPLFSLSFGLYQ